MSTTPKAWMVTISYRNGDISPVYAETLEAAERIAVERLHTTGYISKAIPLYAEHSQPLVDELATVKAERDELREIVVSFVQWMKMQRKEAPIKKAEAYLTKQA